MAVMRMSQEALAAWLGAYSDRAYCEFCQAWEKVTHPILRERRALIREELQRYYAPHIEKLDIDRVSEAYALMLEEALPLLLQLRIDIDLMDMATVAYADAFGGLTFYWNPLYVSNWASSPCAGVSPDSDESHGIGRLLYILDEQRFVEESLRENLYVGLTSDACSFPAGLPDPVLVDWPKDEPMFDAAYLAALGLHEVCHIGLGHFLPIFSDGLFSRLYVGYRAACLQAGREPVIICEADNSDTGLDAVLRLSRLRQVLGRVANAVLDAGIHTILPQIVEVVNVGVKKRLPWSCSGGDGGEGGFDSAGDSSDEPSNRSSQKQSSCGAHRSSSATQQGSSYDDLGSGSDGDAGGDDISDCAATKCRFRRNVQKGTDMRRRIARDVTAVEEVAKGIMRVNKSIGNETGYLDSARAIFARLRRDPFMRLQMHRSHAKSLFGSPIARSTSPRADEVYLRRRGRLGYLPRPSREPIRREVTVILDTSGSMSDRAIALGLAVLRRLVSGSYLFNFIVCDVSPIVIGRRMRQIPESVDVSRGGTDLGNGVRRALEMGLPVESVVYITDGANIDWAEDVTSVRSALILLVDYDGEVVDESLPQSYQESAQARGVDVHIVKMSDIIDAVLE